MTGNPRQMAAVLRGKTRRGSRGAGAAGFTMIELLVTMLILVIIMLGLAALQIGTIRNVTASRRANEAIQLAHRVIEQYQYTPYDSLPGATGGAWLIYSETYAGTTMQLADVAVDGVSKGPYTVEFFVTDQGTNQVITVRVSWAVQDDRAGGTISSVATSIRRYKIL